ncbi:hypothetical protein Goklo_029128 [Gossypium klotzschianum]|uniref:Uncharacterized protein n=1 Tax=Gossypium klotzschianum TaxID=34286 RepID=A0A7J8W602_9ROSI|nr:hypothetical protein [Gossypium klotzschianum]
MEKLVNLQYLDIKGANLIERMPFGIGKLTNLQSLSDYVIGEGDGHHIKELIYLSNLRGDFRLSGLENVTVQDAGEANEENLEHTNKIRTEKEEIGQGSKVWKCSADMSFPEEGFPTNLTSLEISNGPKMYTSLVEWGLNRLTSTQELNIGGEGCSRVVSFQKKG